LTGFTRLCYDCPALRSISLRQGAGTPRMATALPLAFERKTLYTFALRRLRMSSVLKKRKKKMRKHKHKKLRRLQKFLRRKG
jgi:hypothetical protein